MKILLVNDDGIQSIGLRKLAKALSELNHTVFVVAPDSQRSGYSHYMSFRKPIYCTKVNVEGAVSAYSITGTPADCVRFALLQLKFEPDLVLSGPNEGANYSINIMYSGTVSAAQEACISGLKAVALSCRLNSENEAVYDGCIEFTLKYLDKFIKYFKPYTFLNINAPSLPYNEIKGVKVVCLGVHSFNNYYEITAEDEKMGYALDGEPEYGKSENDCDINCLHDGYITITPVTLDQTDYQEIDNVSELFQ